MRCTSSGIGETSWMRPTICGPNVRFGTKWLSITSTCTRSADEMRSMSRCMFTKSAARMLGLIRGMRSTVSVPSHLLEQGDEHGIRAVPVRPQLHLRGIAREFELVHGEVLHDVLGRQLPQFAGMPLQRVADLHARLRQM